MSFLKRMLSSVGIGAAKVDTVLQGDQFVPGEIVEAMINMKGGSTEQDVEKLYISIHCTYEREVEAIDEEDEDTEITSVFLLDKFHVADAFTINPGEEKSFSVSFQLPFNTPLTMGKAKVWVQTGMDIRRAIDPKDRDYIRVVPGEMVSALFGAVQELGFGLKEVECEAVPSGFPRSQPFVQEFEFRPLSGPFSGRLDELEIVCFPEANSVEVFMEIDRKARGITSFLAEMMNMDESRIRFSFGPEELPNLTDMLKDIIEERS